jgi:hypothetical protein
MNKYANDTDFSLLSFPLTDVTNCKRQNSQQQNTKSLNFFKQISTSDCEITLLSQKVIDHDNMSNLPDDLLFMVFSFFHSDTLLNIPVLSKFWRRFSSLENIISKILWQNLYLAEFISPPKGFFVSHNQEKKNYHGKNEFSCTIKELYFQRKRNEAAWITCCYNSCVRSSKTFAKDLFIDRETLIVGINQEFKTIHKAIASSSAFDKIIIMPGTYSSDKAILISKPIEIVGLGNNPKEVVFDRSALIIRENAKVRFSNISFVSPCITTPLNNNAGWLQFDDCLLDHPQFVELSGWHNRALVGNENNYINNSGSYRRSQKTTSRSIFSGSISRSLLNSPNFPNGKYFIAKCVTNYNSSLHNIVMGEIQIGEYDVQFVEE